MFSINKAFIIVIIISSINSLRVISPFKGYREKSRASGMRKETREQGAGERK